MTDRYFFDTDCLSAFLWVRGENILSKLYKNKIILPKQVYNELEKVPYLFKRVNSLLDNKQIRVESIKINTPEFNDYVEMTCSPKDGLKIIGSGEAAGIAMAKHRNGILCSNNLRDIIPYIKKYEIKNMTTGEILIQAMNEGLITEDDGNRIWSDMLAKRRILPALSFSEYLEK